MSRAKSGPSEPVPVKPGNDIYTVLVVVATVVVVLGLIVLWVRAGHVFGGLFAQPKGY